MRLPSAASSTSSRLIPSKTLSPLALPPTVRLFAIGCMTSISGLLYGLGAGQTISVASIYLVEIAPRETRGKLACLLQFFIAIGVMSGYFITYGTQKLSSSMAWRLPFVIQAVFASLFHTIFTSTVNSAR